jgi:hypothetical protein
VREKAQSCTQQGNMFYRALNTSCALFLLMTSFVSFFVRKLSANNIVLPAFLRVFNVKLTNKGGRGEVDLFVSFFPGADSHVRGGRISAGFCFAEACTQQVHSPFHMCIYTYTQTHTHTHASTYTHLCTRTYYSPSGPVPCPTLHRPQIERLLSCQDRMCERIWICTGDGCAAFPPCSGMGSAGHFW